MVSPRLPPATYSSRNPTRFPRYLIILAHGLQRGLKSQRLDITLAPSRPRQYPERRRLLGTPYPTGLFLLKADAPMNIADQ